MLSIPEGYPDKSPELGLGWKNGYSRVGFRVGRHIFQETLDLQLTDRCLGEQRVGPDASFLRYIVLEQTVQQVDVIADSVSWACSSSDSLRYLV